jgi:hypothetical protein
MPDSPQHAAALRSAVWANGYRPVAVVNADAPGMSPGKRPFDMGWQVAAQEPVPRAVRTPPNPRALNTGIWCGGLRPLDIDVDDASVADAIAAMAREMLGIGPVRGRSNSAKRLILYRAADGAPRKRSIVGRMGKIEVLGHGQQFVAYGGHPSGVDYQWDGNDLTTTPYADLVAITEDDVTAFLDAAASVLGVEVKQERSPPTVEARDPGPAPSSSTRESAAFAKALDTETANVRHALSGTRNDTLNTAAFNLFQMVASGWGTASEVEHALTSAAADAGLNPVETRKTIASGRAAGMASPRQPMADRHQSVVTVEIDLDAPKLERTPEGHIIDATTGEVVETSDDDGETPPIDEALTHVPGVLGEMIDFITASARRPNRRLALAVSLGLCGTLTGRRMASPTGLNTHLYVAITYPTGGGKQHVIDAASRILSAAKLERHIGPPDFSSYQALIDHVMQQPASLCCIDEFGAFLNRIISSHGSHENNIPREMMTLWGKSYDAPYMTQRMRQQASVPIYAPTLSICGFSTPAQFYAALKSRDVTSGFLNRFLVLDGGARVEEVEPAISLRNVPDSLKRGVLALYACGHRRGRGNLDSDLPDKNSSLQGDVEPVHVKWGTDGAEAFYYVMSREIFAEIDAHEDGELMGRVADIALRLATIRACSDMPAHPVIMLEHMQWGAAIAMQSARKLMADVQSHMEDQLTAAALEKRFFKLLRANRGQITMRDLRKSLSRHQRNIWDIDALIKTLENAGMIAVVSRPGSGRTGKMVMDAKLVPILRA